MAQINYPNSWVEICNQALGRLGKGQITLLAEGTPIANYCNQYLGSVVHEILSQYDWEGASKRRQLNRLSEVPEFGFEYAYQLPIDYVRAIEVDTNKEPYSIEVDRLLTNAEAVYMKYVAHPTGEPDTLPPYLIEAFVAGLTYKFSIPMTSSEKLRKEVKDEYLDPITGALEKAKIADARRIDEQTVSEERGYVYYDELR